MRLATLSSISLPNHSVRLMASMLNERGYDSDAAMWQAGLREQDVLTPGQMINGQQEIAFQRAFMEQTPDQPETWLELGSRYHLLNHAHTDYGLLMSTAPTVDAAIRIGFTYGDLYYMLADAEGIFSEDGRQIGFMSIPLELPRDMRRFSALRDVGVNCAVFADLWGGPFPFDTVELPVPESDKPFVQKFLPDAKLRFRSTVNRWRWSARLDKRKPPHSDALLHEHYRRSCEHVLTQARNESDIINRVLDVIRRTRGQANIKLVARSLAMSTRSLQRKLGDHGLSYRELATLARHRHACRLLLTTELMMSRVALASGYDNISAFNNAFRRLSGVTPSQYRKGLAFRKTPHTVDSGVKYEKSGGSDAS
ncbi:MAG: helix-turn-helix domain-containing protein [Sphingomonadaceae bacterium]